MTRIKICGCMKVADAVAAAEAGADFIGIMFAPQSRRRQTVEEAALIVRAVGTPLREMEQDEPPPLHRRHGDPSAGSFDTIESWFVHGAEALERVLARKRPLVVGVFADQDIEDVNVIADETGIDLIQLSGSEPWSDALLANRQVINVLRPRPGMTSDEIAAHIEPGAALAFMLDPSSGTGTVGDWEVAAAVAERVPLWLAGGLSPENVGDAIRVVRPWLVDVSTGVETDGVKDAGKMVGFVDAVRASTRHEQDSARTDRSSDLSSRGRSAEARAFEPRRSSPRMVAFPYRGGFRYHVVFSTKDFRPSLQGEWALCAMEGLSAVADATGFMVEAFCVMPNHVHALVAGDAALDSDLTSFAHKFKQKTGYRFKQATGRQLWQRSYYDHVLRPDEPPEAHAAYIIGNPVSAGLVDTVEQWPYSGPEHMLPLATVRDRSLDLSVQVAAVEREFKDHETGLPS